MWCYGHMTNQVQLLHPTNSATAWASINPVLLEGEIGIEAGSLRVKIGDGVHKWSDLPYSRSTGNMLTAGNGILMSDTEEFDIVISTNQIISTVLRYEVIG